MPLETATYLSQLVVSNPANSDPLSQADDHMRLIKATVKATFPNFTAAALNSTQAQIDYATSQIVSGTGAVVPIGSLIDFAGTAAPTGYLACDGQAVSRTTYAALFTAIGTTWGTGDGSTTFNVPNLLDRYRRHRNTGGGNFAGAVGTIQAADTAPHTHVATGNTSVQSADHTHSFSGNTGAMSANASHSHSIPNYLGGSTALMGTGAFSTPISPVSGAVTGTTNTDHTHAFSGTTSGISANHTHSFNVTTSSYGGTETRPISATVLTCIRAL